MNSLSAGIKNELIKLYFHKKISAIFIFSALVPAAAALLISKLQSLLGIIALNEAFPVQVLSLFTFFLLPLFIFLISADLFPEELAAGTLKITLLRPITRFRVFLSKTAVLGICIAALLLVIGISSAVADLFIGSGAGLGILSGVKAYVAAFIPMMALGIASVFVAQFFKGTSGAIVFSILLYAAAKLLPLFFHSASAFSIAAYTDWHTLWLGGQAASGKLASTFLFLVSSSVLLFTGGYYMFDRKEL